MHLLTHHAQGYWINYGFWFGKSSNNSSRVRPATDTECPVPVAQHGSFQWRFPIAFQAVFGMVLIVGILLFPESPRWLLNHGKREAGAEILACLEGKNQDDPEVISDLEQIERINAITQGSNLTWKEFFSNGKEMNLWRASVACASQAFQQIGESE
jgi:hypothetical protein